MGWVKGLAIALLAVLLALVPMMECQEPFVPNRPFCISQLAIVNHACSMLPYTPLPPPAPPTPAPAPAPSDDEDDAGEDDEGGDDEGGDDSGEDDEGGDDSGGDDEDNNQRGRRHRHGHAHAHSHSNSSSNGTAHHGRHGRHHSRHRHRHVHRHGHMHRHRHRHHYIQESPIQEECCRWLKQVDSACVCQLLIHLPPFLAKPAHQYTVIIDESCSVTFTCGGRLKLSV